MVVNKNLQKSLIASIFLGALSVSQAEAMPLKEKDVWGMYQGNAAHTGYLPLKIKPKEIVQVWQKNIDEKPSTGPFYNIHPASVTPKYVIVTRNYDRLSNSLKVFSIATGKEIWSKNFNDLSIQPAAYHDGVVYVQTVNNSLGGTLLRAFEVATGKVLFETPFTAQWHNYKAPVIDGNKVIACAGYIGGLTAYDRLMGSASWSRSFNELSNMATAAVSTKYALYYNAGKLYKLNKADGQVISKIQDTSWQWNGYDDATPVLIGEDSALISTNHYLSKFNLKEDKIDFVFDGIQGNPSVDLDNIYVIQNHHLTIIDKDSGELLWSDLTNEYDSNVSDIVITKNLIFVSTDKGTKAYTKTRKHEIVWESSVGGALSINASGLYIVSSKGQLTAFSFE